MACKKEKSQKSWIKTHCRGGKPPPPQKKKNTRGTDSVTRFKDTVLTKCSLEV